MGLLRKAFDKAADLYAAKEKFDDAVVSPIRGKKLHAMTLSVPGRLSAIVELSGIVRTGDNGSGREDWPEWVALRLDVDHPSGPADVAVRQVLPNLIRRMLQPGLPVPVLTSPDDPRLARLDWEGLGRQYGLNVASVPSERHEIKWLDAEDAPERGRFGFDYTGKTAKRLGTALAAWPARPAVVMATALTNEHERHRYVLAFDVSFGGPSTMRVLSDVPSLVFARLVDHVIVSGFSATYVFRTGIPVVVHVAPDGSDAVIDWETTMRYPEYRDLGPADIRTR